MLHIDLTDMHTDSITDAIYDSTGPIDESSSCTIEGEEESLFCTLSDIYRPFDTIRELDIDV